MTDRISCGAAQLDVVLGGGLLVNGITLVIGVPGAGKTILAQQCAFANARPERPVLYLSTVSEPLEKILRFGQALSFFDSGLIGTAVYYDDLGAVLQGCGLSGVLDRVRDLIRARRPGMIVIDSFKALHPYAEGRSGFRRFLHDLAGLLSGFPVTSLWIGEYDVDDIVVAPEFAVADAIVVLGSGQTAERSARALQVLKMRGGDFMSGRHAYRLSADGIGVFPRLADVGDPTGYDFTGARVPSGIQALDDMLRDGYCAGTSTLVVGPTGIGKTVMGMHFVFCAAELGEPVVIATMQEDPSQLERMVRSFGWSLTRDNVSLMYRSPVDLYVDEWVHDLLRVVEVTGSTRVFVDSLGDLRSASPDPVRFREYMYSLLRRCSRRGVSIMMTHEVADLAGLNELTAEHGAQMADNVVVLQYRIDVAASRTVTVLKTRGSEHDPYVREFEITAEGIRLIAAPRPAE